MVMQFHKGCGGTAMIQRPKYMSFLEEWKNHQIIKAVSCIRRCGKSTIFDLFREKLLSEGVKPEQIIFLDDIQHVKQYEKAVNSLFTKKNTYVYMICA